MLLGPDLVTALRSTMKRNCLGMRNVFITFYVKNEFNAHNYEDIVLCSTLYYISFMFMYMTANVNDIILDLLCSFRVHYFLNTCPLFECYENINQLERAII